MIDPSFEHPDAAVIKDLVIRGLSHPHLLAPPEVLALCEHLLGDLFTFDEQVQIISLLETIALR